MDKFKEMLHAARSNIENRVGDTNFFFNSQLLKSLVEDLQSTDSSLAAIDSAPERTLDQYEKNFLLAILCLVVIAEMRPEKLNQPATVAVLLSEFLPRKMSEEEIAAGLKRVKIKKEDKLIPHLKLLQLGIRGLLNASSGHRSKMDRLEELSRYLADNAQLS